jgi:hypothetical protein
LNSIARVRTPKLPSFGHWRLASPHRWAFVIYGRELCPHLLTFEAEEPQYPLTVSFAGGHNTPPFKQCNPPRSQSMFHFALYSSCLLTSSERPTPLDRGGRSLKASHYGMHLRLMSLTGARLNLTRDFPFLATFTNSIFWGSYNRTDQGCFRQVTVVTLRYRTPLVSTSEWPTPVHAIFRAGTRSTTVKNP